MKAAMESIQLSVQLSSRSNSTYFSSENVNFSNWMPLYRFHRMSRKCRFFQMCVRFQFCLTDFTINWLECSYAIQCITTSTICICAYWTVHKMLIDLFWFNLFFSLAQTPIITKSSSIFVFFGCHPNRSNNTKCCVSPILPAT